jgi:hypothetical protein
MLEALILNHRRAPNLTIALLAALAAAFFTSCAAQKPAPALVDDPDAQRASAIPWNKPQPWEGHPNMPTGLGSESHLSGGY